MKQVDPASKYLIVRDLASGCHQLKIATEDSHLCEFLLEDSVYHYARQPMEFVNSRHRFLNNVTRLIVDHDIIKGSG